jgi:hypothetical protein
VPVNPSFGCRERVYIASAAVANNSLVVKTRRQGTFPRAAIMGVEDTATRTIEDVQSEDAAFRAAEATAPPMDPAEEGAALKGMLSDAGTCDRCGRVAAARWGACAIVADAARAMGDEELGVKIGRVVEDLDAAHLRPTSIRKRLDDGVDAACHGVVTLLANLK